MKVQASILRTKSAFGCLFKQLKGIRDIILMELALALRSVRLSVKASAVTLLSFRMVQTAPPLNFVSEYRKVPTGGTLKKIIKYS